MGDIIYSANNESLFKEWSLMSRIALLVVVAALSLSVKSQSLRFLTFNIWGDYFNNPVEEREKGVEATILNSRADVVALQEVTPNWYKSQMFFNLVKA